MLKQARGKALDSLHRSVRAGAAMTTLLAFGISGWAANAQLASAVIAPGLLVVASNVKRVQHPTGGVVSELRVRDGAFVEAGEILIRLDETATRAGLGVITKRMDELLARQSRLAAEQAGAAEIIPPPEFVRRSDDPDIARLARDEAALFAARRDARLGLVSQLRERIEQMNEQILGLHEQVESKKRELGLIRKELIGVRELWRKNLIQITRVTSLEREEARLDGERGALLSTIAQAKGRISETQLQIRQLDQDLARDVGKELSEVRAGLAELAERRVAAEDLLNRIDIRSPQAGVVHQLAVHTVGGVIAAGEQIMLIVPQTEALFVESRLSPQDIDQVRVGLQATMRFPAFNQRTTPELKGQIDYVSADISQDSKTGQNFYSLRISLAKDQTELLGGMKLLPGMPVETFIRTGDRTVISYLTKPLADQVARAWRER